MHIGYIPSDTIFSRRLQTQKRLPEDVAYATMETLKPQIVAVVMEPSHLCIVMRGVEKTNDTILTNCVLVCFERKSKARNEFLHCIFVGVNQ
ncbi:hypothetical protein EDB81DRAFT_872390 [Dactylonectria macrodidyma]|uniref:GTP cyclohydrolase 1 n=1 Tax=Dactylonectria macrodidyma TaxID=307937 RepID=A0A9P9DSQ3_9HYPO|nr:hypothetical protein EDB81DRAFT_872390 [Dactylonectria macrodidyma]